MKKHPDLDCFLAVSAFAVLSSLANPCASREPPSPDTFHLLLGFGGLRHPEYPGARHEIVSGVPLFTASYNEYFLSTTQGGLGYYLIQDGPLKVGAALGGDLRSPRKEADDSHLHGLGDIHSTMTGTLFANLNLPWFGVKTSGVTDIGGEHQGTRLSLDLEGRFSPAEDLIVSADWGLTWADSKYSQTFFGVDPVQSARSELPSYTAEGGVNQRRYSVGVNYNLTEHWGVSAKGTIAKLCGDAAHSPVTETTSQDSIAVSTSLHF